MRGDTLAIGDGQRLDFAGGKQICELRNPTDNEVKRSYTIYFHVFYVKYDVGNDFRC